MPIVVTFNFTDTHLIIEGGDCCYVYSYNKVVGPELHYTIYVYRDRCEIKYCTYFNNEIVVECNLNIRNGGKILVKYKGKTYTYKCFERKNAQEIFGNIYEDHSLILPNLP